MSEKTNELRHPVWCVCWGDAFIDTKDFDADEAAKTEPVYRKTVGFLVARNQHGIVLATDEYDKAEDGVAGKLFIPHSMTNEVIIMAPKKRRKRK